MVTARKVFVYLSLFSVIILSGGVAHAVPVNTTNTKCECYYDADCPDTEEGKGVCWYVTGCSAHDDGGKTLDGTCGFVGGGGGSGTAGSSCGSVDPGDVARVLKAWTSGFDKAGASGGGPVGRFTAKAYKLSHLLIPSIRCRLEIARKALDLQELTRTTAYLEHPELHHDVEDHVVADISTDHCRQQLGKISAKALQLAITGAPERAAAHLARIPPACPGGQTLGGKCEGAADEIACLGERLEVMAQFITTPPSGTCGDGVVGADEQCELDGHCGDGNRCLTCRCVSSICGLVLCGDGNVDPGEECDDGNTTDNDSCQNCKTAMCGDGIVCDGPSCTSGKDGGPEYCDPPGPTSPSCLYSCLPDCSCEVILE